LPDVARPSPLTAEERRGPGFLRQHIRT
jgi:hypothetical protein